MTHKPHSGRKGQHQQPPFEIVLDDSCSIVCDDIPVNCTIKVMPVDGRSPPRFSPHSQARWIEDYSHYPEPESPRGGRDRAPFQRDKYCKVVGSPIASRPSPMRSRKSIVDSVRRNIQENSGVATSSGIHKCGGGSEYDIFDLRKPNCIHEFSDNPSPTSSFASSGSYSPSESHHPSSPLPEQSVVIDRLLNSNRRKVNFTRLNMDVDGTDLHEMHSNLGPWGEQTSLPAAQSSTSKNRTPQWTSPSPQSSPTSCPSPPIPARGGRCCAMADYDPSNYRSKTPERDSSDTSSALGGVSMGGPCSYHGSQPCPAHAGSYCRTNRARGSNSPPPPGLRGVRSCKYHVSLPCPALAGVPCRGEIQKAGFSTPQTSRTPSPDPSSRSPSRSPHSPGQDTTSQSMPESKSIQSRRASRSAGVAYPPRTIAPPPRSPRSRSPTTRASHKSKGFCKLLGLAFLDMTEPPG